MGRGKLVLNEEEQLLLMQYYDGECSEAEQIIVERLLSESAQAEQLIESFGSLGCLVREWSAEESASFNCANSMARAGVGKLAKITIQSAAQVDVPNTLQEITSSSALFDWRNWLFGFGWASSGALVAASIFMLLSVPSVEHQAQPGRVAADNPFNASFVKGIELPVQNQKESLEKLANQDLARSKAVELNKMAVVIPQESSATHPDVLIVE